MGHDGHRVGGGGVTRQLRPSSSLAGGDRLTPRGAPVHCTKQYLECAMAYLESLPLTSDFDDVEEEEGL